MGANARISERHYSELKLDNENPRLPDGFENASQSELLKLFYGQYCLEELAASYIENGFFPAEALIILADGTVIEGNRRLAALKFLFHDEDAVDAGIEEYDGAEQASPDVLAKLEEVPVFEYTNRGELSAYLGFHHINGSMQWSPSAKARYITKRVDACAKEGEDNPFYSVAREVGSNTVGIRNAYQQFCLLKKAQIDFGIVRAKSVLDNRFGVWARLTSSKTVFSYIGFCPKDNRYQSIVEALDNLNKDNFSRLLEDLTTTEDGRPPLLNDSRQASRYANLLSNQNALEILRATRDFDLADFIASGNSLNRKIRDVLERLNSIEQDLANKIDVDSESKELITSVLSTTLAIQSRIDFSLSISMAARTDG